MREAVLSSADRVPVLCLVARSFHSAEQITETVARTKSRKIDRAASRPKFGSWKQCLHLLRQEQVLSLEQAYASPSTESWGLDCSPSQSVCPSEADPEADPIETQAGGFST